MMGRLTLCADDFGMSRAISETIASLAEQKKINATSCMAVCEGWRSDSPLLGDLPAPFQIGLHLTLTEKRPLSPMRQLARGGRMPTINSLARSAFSNRLPLEEIDKELSAQFEAFTHALGRPPDFVDGHQHAHVLPGIRRRVLAATVRYAPGAWLRDCTDNLMGMLARPWRLKAIASAVHSLGLGASARTHGLRTNCGFSGHYDFACDYASLFPAFLRRAGTDHLVMCHPGSGRAAGDSIAAAREIEARALRRLPIAELAERHGLTFDR